MVHVGYGWLAAPNVRDLIFMKYANLSRSKIFNFMLNDESTWKRIPVCLLRLLLRKEISYEYTGELKCYRRLQKGVGIS